MEPATGGICTSANNMLFAVVSKNSAKWIVIFKAYAQ
jgi:hypothetical protein